MCSQPAQNMKYLDIEELQKAFNKLGHKGPIMVGHLFLQNTSAPNQSTWFGSIQVRSLVFNARGTSRCVFPSSDGSQKMPDDVKAGDMAIFIPFYPRNANPYACIWTSVKDIPTQYFKEQGVIITWLLRFLDFLVQRKLIKEN